MVAGPVQPLRRLALLTSTLALLVVSPAARGADVGAGTTRIYNGSPTSEYPAVAGLGIAFSDGAVGYCTGTLIAPDIVLTAAHCLEGDVDTAEAIFFPDATSYVVHAGLRYIRHSEYVDDVAAFADIALIRLTEPVTSVTPMPYATSKPRTRARGTIVGYGDDGQGNSGTKQVGEVRLKKCPLAMRRAGLQRGQLLTSLCWKPKPRTSDTCKGDSGGPLIVDGVVAGVTAGGFPTCPGKLSWDTNVALFAPWIEAAIAVLRQP